jgi:glycosyltransferase involved in cell wall biosynthesis
VIKRSDHAAPFKLLYLINGLGPGGAERSLAELIPYYLANGITPLVVCLRSRQTGVESDIRRLGCEIRLLPGGGLLARAFAVRRLLREEAVDLIHTTLFESDVVGRIAAIGTGVPVLCSLVNTSYDPVRLRDPNVRRTRLWAAKTIDGWTARHLTSHFHAITQSVKESAIEMLGIPAERVSVIERGRAPDRLGSPSPARRAAARRRLGIASDAEVVVNVARQEYQKGQAHLMEAAAILARSRPRLVVLIAGREGHASHRLLDRGDRLGLGDRIRFLGHRDDVPEILAAADVFAFPSVYEGLGGAVLEAMALGLPIVASDIPALREVVEDGANGFLVPPESPPDLALALERILDSPSLASAFGSRSLEIFRGRFTLQQSAERMVNLYHRVAGLRNDTGMRLVPQRGGALV